MSKTLPLLRGDITYSAAQSKEINILHRLDYPRQQSEFFTSLDNRRSWIKAVVAHQLNLSSSESCLVADTKDWLHGSFNVCIPVSIANWKRKQQPGERVLLRIPLPYRGGEAFRPGNGDEKIRCEAGTYAWLQQNCPRVPIPHLYGFALSTGETFTSIENLPLLKRFAHRLYRAILCLLNRPIPTKYVRHQGGHEISSDAKLGYVLVEYIEETRGKMLSCDWAEKNTDVNLRTNLYRDLSRIFLDLARIPLPKIGSFVIDNTGFLRLANRPLVLGVQELENEKIPVDIPRDRTYSTVDSYVGDILSIHDSRLENQPNAINDLMDYAYQAGALTAMRATFPSFFRRDLRHGPFTFMLTDLHQSNIFVDENWHITFLVDLEWGSSLPIEMLQPPHWFTNRYVDTIDSKEFNKARIVFMDILTAEENQHTHLGPDDEDKAEETMKLSAIMNRSWEMGTFWYSLALSSPTGIFTLFYEKLQQKFTAKCPDHDAFHRIMPWYWSPDFVSIMVRKVKDRKDYDSELRKAFEEETHDF